MRRPLPCFDDGLVIFFGLKAQDGKAETALPGDGLGVAGPGIAAGLGEDGLDVVDEVQRTRRICCLPSSGGQQDHPDEGVGDFRHCLKPTVAGGTFSQSIIWRHGSVCSG
jgi:hypothetical protein